MTVAYALRILSDDLILNTSAKDFGGGEMRGRRNTNSPTGLDKTAQPGE
jgi:hypothetical protein